MSDNQAKECCKHVWDMVNAYNILRQEYSAGELSPRNSAEDQEFPPSSVIATNVPGAKLPPT